MYINLHTHTKFSDGVLYPLDVINESLKNKVDYLSITDHDTINGLLVLNDEIRKKIKFIDGIEISTSNHDYLHILGYNIDIKNKSFLSKLEEWRKRRESRVRDIIKKLNEINIEISFDELELDKNTTVGRPHIADTMIKKGYGKTRTEVFHKYLIEGCYSYIKPRGPDIKEAIKAIKDAGGIVVLAHPSTIEGSFNIEDVIKMGFDGIEVYYPTHTNNKVKKYLDIAKKYNLIVSCGTDYHGPTTGRDVLAKFKYSEISLLNIDRILNP